LLLASCSENPSAYTLFSTGGENAAGRNFVAVFNESTDPKVNHKACFIEKQKVQNKASDGKKHPWYGLDVGG
jgi:hypothetical protein